MAKGRQATTTKRIVIGTPRADDPDALRRAAGKVPRSTEGKAWYFVIGHFDPVFLTGTEPYIRKWADGSPMTAMGSRDTIAAATARRHAGAKTEEVERDG